MCIVQQSPAYLVDQTQVHCIRVVLQLSLHACCTSVPASQYHASTCIACQRLQQLLFCEHELHVAASHCLLLHPLLVRIAAAASVQRMYLAALVV